MTNKEYKQKIIYFKYDSFRQTVIRILITIKLLICMNLNSMQKKLSKSKIIAGNIHCFES